MSSPATYSFKLYQGQTWVEPLQLKNADGTDMNLTGYSARMHVRRDIGDATTVLELDGVNGRLTIPTPLEGRLLLRVEAEDTAALVLPNYEVQSWVYDLEIFMPGPPEYVQRVLQGYVLAFPEVTRA